MSQPYYPLPPAPPPARRPAAPPLWIWIGSVVVAWLIGIGVGVAFGAGMDGSGPSAAPEPLKAAATTTRPPPKRTTTTTTTTTTPPAPPKAGDFSIAITVLEKECFGSAGCLVTYRIEPSYNGTASLDPSETYTVVYEVTGGSEPQINRFTITGDTATFPSDEMLQTPSSSAKLAAKATSVLED